ncbi:hypothetical protein E2C01_049425 [Portunus trituberculatus]|uniref:Uncharacterized protein n=1 Tax=Portunus trituberculatus TaxID=210409 RepID=A0A5B7GDU9_PORTR|nr:hypothetical protein [Portunus trituberculatus]
MPPFHSSTLNTPRRDISSPQPGNNVHHKVNTNYTRHTAPPTQPCPAQPPGTPRPASLGHFNGPRGVQKLMWV